MPLKLQGHPLLTQPKRYCQKFYHLPWEVINGTVVCSQHEDRTVTLYNFPMSPISSMRSRVILKLNHEHLEIL